MQSVKILPIQPQHNASIEKVIKLVFEEHGINKPGTAYYDKSLTCMYESYTGDNMMYFIVELNNAVVGGAGIFPTPGLPVTTCELVKMYILPEARGYGIGKKLLQQCLQAAINQGYKYVYLETMPELSKAIGLYSQFGFKPLNKPLGNSGHFACPIQMIKDL